MACFHGDEKWPSVSDKRNSAVMYGTRAAVYSLRSHVGSRSEPHCFRGGMQMARATGQKFRSDVLSELRRWSKRRRWSYTSDLGINEIVIFSWWKLGLEPDFVLPRRLSTVLQTRRAVLPATLISSFQHDAGVDGTNLLLFFRASLNAVRDPGVFLALNLSSRWESFLEVWQSSSYQGRRHRLRRVTVFRGAISSRRSDYLDYQLDYRCQVFGHQFYTVQKALVDEWIPLI